MRYSGLFLLCCVCLLLQCGDGGGPDPGDKPLNIIFLMADDHRVNTIGAHGHPFVQTPNLDWLSDNGVNFNNAYTAAAICVPSRTSFFTGLPQRVHGIGFSTNQLLTEDQWELTYPAILQKAGYHTGFIGKFGVEAYTFRDNPGQKFDYFWGHNNWTRFYPKECGLSSCLPYHHAKKDIITDIMGEGIKSFLDTVPESKPFCLSVSFSAPHGKVLRSMFEGCTERQLLVCNDVRNTKTWEHEIYGNLYRDQEFDLPRECGASPYKFIPKDVLDQGEGRKNVYSYDYHKGACREHYIRYYQLITGIDAVVGKLVKQLKERGQLDNTVIIYTSDHGLLMGEYGMGGKSLLYDLTAKIPLIVFAPGLSNDKRGAFLNELVSSTDVSKTILDFAGLEAPDEMQGQSLVPLMNGEADVWRQELFLESLFTKRGNPFIEAVTNGSFKYVRYFTGEVNYDPAELSFDKQVPIFEQLFDLNADPEEKNNLIDDERLHTLKVMLRNSCDDHSKAYSEARKVYQENVKTKTVEEDLEI